MSLIANDLLLAALGAVLWWFALRILRDIKGVSIKSNQAKIDNAHRLTIIIASDLEAAAPGNAEVKRLAKLLLDLELWK